MLSGRHRRAAGGRWGRLGDGRNRAGGPARRRRRNRLSRRCGGRGRRALSWGAAAPGRRSGGGAAAGACAGPAVRPLRRRAVLLAPAEPPRRAAYAAAGGAAAPGGCWGGAAFGRRRATLLVGRGLARALRPAAARLLRLAGLRERSPSPGRPHGVAAAGDRHGGQDGCGNQECRACHANSSPGGSVRACSDSAHRARNRRSDQQQCQQHDKTTAARKVPSAACDKPHARVLGVFRRRRGAARSGPAARPAVS